MLGELQNIICVRRVFLFHLGVLNKDLVHFSLAISTTEHLLQTMLANPEILHSGVSSSILFSLGGPCVARSDPLIWDRSPLSGVTASWGTWGHWDVLLELMSPAALPCFREWSGR